MGEGPSPFHNRAGPGSKHRAPQPTPVHAARNSAVQLMLRGVEPRRRCSTFKIVRFCVCAATGPPLLTLVRPISRAKGAASGVRVWLLFSLQRYRVSQAAATWRTVSFEDRE